MVVQNRSQNISKKSLLIALLILTLVVRIVTVFLIHKVPCMDLGYWTEADNIINRFGKQFIGVTPTYGLMLYALTSIFKSLFIASSISYIIGSFLVSVFMYLIAKEVFDQKTGLITLAIMLFLPNLTVAVAGYSHALTVTLAFLLIAIYVLILGNLSKLKLTTSGILFSIFSILAIYIRPENILVLFPILLLTILNKNLVLRQRILLILSSSVFIIVGIAIHGWFMKQVSSSPTVGLFSDSKYSYMTFMHTLSIRNGTGIVDSFATALSLKKFGTPESNNWSIAKAIMVNPKEFLANVVFNVKELLDIFAHPLYYPFYLYPFIGAGLFDSFKRGNGFLNLLLPVLFFTSIVPVLIFHIEIRYLLNSLVPILLLTGYGISKLGSDRRIKIVLACCVIANAIIYMVYLLNNMRMDNLCG